MDAQGEPVRERTLQRLADLGKHKAALDARDARLSTARGLTFLPTAALSLYGLFRPSAPVWLGAGAAFALFALFVVRHALVAARQFEAGRRIDLARRSLERQGGTFRAADREAHRRGEQFAVTGHPYAADLDLFGPGSLFEQLDVAQTPGGEARLAQWLLAPAGRDDALARQQAVRELAGAEQFREDLALAGMRAASSSSPADHRALAHWAAESSAGVPVFLLAPLVAAQLGALAATPLGIAWLAQLWLPLIGAQIAVMMVLRRRIDAVLGPVTHKESPLGAYPEMMRLCQSREFGDPLLAARRDALTRGGGAASAIARLDRLLGMAAVRHNALVHLMADALVMWDAWAAWRISSWRRRFGASLDAWLDALADVEALACLGTFAAEHPTFAWPTLSAAGSGPHFEARALGHPLIAPSARVNNDVSLGTPRALMITGSNMSGKSTMLRSIGVAAVLAQAGAPVCAAELDMSELSVWTSMRVIDSLSEGASRFFAEVRRLKAVLDAVRAPGAPVLFLLDEVLHGTNSRERVIGAKAVVAHLCASGAIGAVSSHDLGLVTLEADTAGAVANVHFEEQVADGSMAFDYRMRPGPVGTSNALRLMRQVGIDVVPLE